MALFLSAQLYKHEFGQAAMRVLEEKACYFRPKLLVGHVQITAPFGLELLEIVDGLASHCNYPPHPIFVLF